MRPFIDYKKAHLSNDRLRTDFWLLDKTYIAHLHVSNTHLIIFNNRYKISHSKAYRSTVEAQWLVSLMMMVGAAKLNISFMSPMPYWMESYKITQE